jgi:HD-GYP domain-containing protein (c-di-GMP phosphodiesterase class II)
MNLPQDTITGLRLAGLVHDIGKVRIPTEILTNPNGLTEAEFSIIKVHPTTGHEILGSIDFPWPIAEAVYQHHERLDGSGYPRGISDRDIITEARILAVADVVEAIASHRPYRPARGVDAALQEVLDQRGLLYDPGAVDACLALFRQDGYTLK